MYWIISAFILAVTSLLERGVYKRVAYQFSLFVLFVIISGSYFNGIDWINYNKHYQEIYNNGFPVDFLPYEPGFVLIMYIIGSLFRINNFHVVILVITFFFVISFAKFIKNTNMRFNRSLLMLMMVLFLLPLFNDAIRQLAALTIMLPVLAESEQFLNQENFF
ncbi:EpsG family protein [Erwinia sp. LJJL01]|uniref:EpsG family protein n=1 Tax=Erwinia sp. LJJL01 TaxID=3391839 RepID=UPI0039AF596D